MAGFNLQRDRYGIVPDYEQQVLEQLSDFEMPAVMPGDLDELRKLICDYALGAGVCVALGATTIDAAYAWCRVLCQGAQDSSMGLVRLVDTYPGATQTIDEAIRRFGEYFALQDMRALMRLKKTAVAAILAGRSDDAVRAAIADEASQITPNPPAAVLAAALHAAIGECRRNTQWMTNRGSRA